MSVRERLEDAKLLWEHGRKEGAWIQVLIAAAATSRQRFPKMSDNKRFKEFIKQVTPTIIDGNLRPPSNGNIILVFGGDTSNEISLEELIYEHLRCNLLHEAVISSRVGLSSSHLVDGKLVADIVVGEPLMVPDFWVLNLAKAVADAPENATSCVGVFT